MTDERRQLRGRAAIVGASDAVSPTGELDRYGRALEADVIAAALDDAGLDISDVDGLASAAGPMATLQLAEYLGIHPRWTDTTSIGGSSYETHVEHAAAAIGFGLADVVVSVHAQTPRGDRRRGHQQMRRPDMYGSALLEFEAPYGLRMPIGAYAMAASRHMALYGTTSEQLARIAVDTRAWASMNPRAKNQDPITIDDVLASSMECEPLHKLDCCLVTDGAGAVVVTGAERAADLRCPPVYVLGCGTAHDHSTISQMPDLTQTCGVVSGRSAFEMAGVKPSDIDVAELYDSFTITVLLALEDLGFCAKGEGGAFVEDGRLGPGGAFPANTNGGGLSYTHPGQYGMFLIVEAVRQLRGECEDRQVPDCEVAVASGSGGVLSAMATCVLGSAATT